jgi:hypothetical protein
MDYICWGRRVFPGKAEKPGYDTVIIGTVKKCCFMEEWVVED